MRWIEIDLTRDANRSTRDVMETVRDRQSELPRLQGDLGMDHVGIVRFLAEQGGRLFEVVRGQIDTDLTLGDGEDLGLHLRIEPRDLDLPWTCLHDGLRFLLERMAICASPHPRDHDDGAPWRRRQRDVRFAESALGSENAGQVARRFRPDGCAEPEILFVAAADAPAARSDQERQTIKAALTRECGGVRLASLGTLSQSPSPSLMLRHARRDQAFHYAASTVKPGPVAQTAPILGAWSDLPEAGDELEVVGVDPVDALLDSLDERAAAAAPIAVAAPAAAWRFEDGHLRPEDLGTEAPELVVSNSYLSLAALGERFLDAGAGAFVGTQALVAAGDARDAAAALYASLAHGHGVAAALRHAALSSRERRGADHPLWLSYGVVGAGELALQFL